MHNIKAVGQISLKLLEIFLGLKCHLETRVIIGIYKDGCVESDQTFSKAKIQPLVVANSRKSKAIMW